MRRTGLRAGAARSTGDGEQGQEGQRTAVAGAVGASGSDVGGIGAGESRCWSGQAPWRHPGDSGSDLALCVTKERHVNEWTMRRRSISLRVLCCGCCGCGWCCSGG